MTVMSSSNILFNRAPWFRRQVPCPYATLAALAVIAAIEVYKIAKVLFLGTNETLCDTTQL
jgi:hypothetical protein